MERTNSPLAPVGIGCARLGEATSGLSWRGSVNLVRSAAADGVTFFDTADAYTSGTSERILGRALGRRRSDVTLATKAGYLFRSRSELEARARFFAGPVLRRLGQRTVSATTTSDNYSAQDFSPEHLRTALHESLARLRTTYVDLFQLHAPRGVEVASVMELIRELRQAGTIRQFGLGIEALAEAEPWLDVEGLDSIQLPYSIVAAGSGALIERARRRGVSIVARGVLGTGGVGDERPVDVTTPRGRTIAALRDIAAETGTSARDLAIDFARARAGVDAVLVGVRLPRHLPDVVRATQRTEMDTDLLSRLEEIAAPDIGGG